MAKELFNDQGEPANDKPKFGIVVDGSSRGNPGPSAYQGFDLRTGENLFYNEIGLATNNVAEYLGIVHALMYMKKNMGFIGSTVYSDSTVAMGWAKKRACNSYSLKEKLKEGKDVEKALKLISRSDMWMIEQKKDFDIQWWDKKLWGENPADFGFKTPYVAPENKSSEGPSDKFNERKTWFNEK